MPRFGSSEMPAVIFCNSAAERLNCYNFWCTCGMDSCAGGIVMVESDEETQKGI
mgnify:CR=1 FL=1